MRVPVYEINSYFTFLELFSVYKVGSETRPSIVLFFIIINSLIFSVNLTCFSTEKRQLLKCSLRKCGLNQADVNIQAIV